MAIGKNSHLPLKQCPNCSGKGKVKCPDCKGKGRPFDCQTYWGTGKERNEGDMKEGRVVSCNRCSGAGEIARV